MMLCNPEIKYLALIKEGFSNYSVEILGSNVGMDSMYCVAYFFNYYNYTDLN
jgi:hypothetical protein